MLASAVISFFLSATGIGIIVTIWLEASLFLAFLHLIDNRKDENRFQYLLPRTGPANLSYRTSKGNFYLALGFTPLYPRHH